jgi:hypothetical protein
MGTIETLNRQLEICDVCAIILDPDGDAPAIAYWLQNGDHITDVHHDDETCQRIWDEMEERLSHDDFLKYHNMFIRTDAISRFEQGDTHELGPHLIFWFVNGRSLIQQYNNPGEAVGDAHEITKILDTLQEIRASRGRPDTPQ